MLIDPCAGDGEAILTLRDLWAETFPENHDVHADPLLEKPRVLACELEKERAAQLHRSVGYSEGETFQGDAFHLVSEVEASDGATVLYLNPPYDHDPELERLEHRFLVRFTRHLHPGEGFLFFLIPHGALAASAEFLAREYLDLRAYRLPDEHYEAFRQILIVGRRAPKTLATASRLAEIEHWAEDPAHLPVLPERCPDPLIVSPEVFFRQTYRLEALDLSRAFEECPPWSEAPLGLEHSVEDLLGARFTTAVPPRPVHMALALAAGIFNGRELEPNDPFRHPPVIAKGTFYRELHKVDENFDKEGELTSTVEVERPLLSVSILRLDTFGFRTLRLGTTPTGSDDPNDWNTADLIANYTRSLTQSLRSQFPAIHDPADLEAQIELPELPRTPYTIQHHAIQASLKLLARGLNPFLIAEVGTGKSTMSLFVAAALSPEHHAKTVRELERIGHPSELPVVRRTLILCPPHLLKSWQDQAAAVMPDARVQIVRTSEDLEAEAEIYVLSRETAKLGHRFEGIAGRCPRCHARVKYSAKNNATRRRRCEATHRRPLNDSARLAERLAAFLAHLVPENGTVQSLIRGPVLERLVRRRLEGKVELATPRVDALQESLFFDLERRVERQLETSSGYEALTYRLGEILRLLSHFLGTTAELRENVRRLVERFPENRRYRSPATELERLAAQLRADVEEPLSLERVVERLTKQLEQLHARGEWAQSEPCGEPLFQATPNPRRYPLAKLIQRRYKHRFGALIVDEAHEYNRKESAQTKAAHRLINLPGVPTIVLTGSLMGGYASSLFPNMWALSPKFRDEFERDDVQRFVKAYGYRKMLVDAKKRGDEAVRRGTQSDRELDGYRNLGEAPGVLPLFLLRHLLPTAILVHKADLDHELPELEEVPAPIFLPGDDPMAQKLGSEYLRLQGILLRHIKQDRFCPKYSGRLLGALVEMPSYLDRCTDDLPPYEIAYPEKLGGALIARGQQFPAEWRTPKEAWLLERLRHHLGRGERTIVFLQHTGTQHLPRRLEKLIAEELTPSVAWLDAQKVPTAKREAWIDQHVIDAEVEVLLVNPNAVRTGLNNLVAFSVGIWYERDYNATTYRQANGRLHRIGQTRPVTVEFPYYADTAQEIAFELIAQKISASLQVDGLDIRAALAAAGASEEEDAALGTALSLGEAVYEALTREPTPNA